MPRKRTLKRNVATWAPQFPQSPVVVVGDGGGRGGRGVVGGG